jgi:protein-disulfide isomerase
VTSRPRWTCAILCLLAVGCFFALAACGGDDDDATAAASPTAKATATPAGVTGDGTPQSDYGKKINSAQVPEQMADGQRIGAADAKVTIEAYEDFGCPHCLEFTALIEPVLMKEYVATGKVAFVYRFFPLRQLTAIAAIGAYCAGEQDKFWPFHRMLFVAQAEANEQTGPPLTDVFVEAGLQTLAADAGLDSIAFEACLSSDAAINAVQADLKTVNDLGLPGTPSFVINGKVTQTPATIGEWRKLLDGLLK